MVVLGRGWFGIRSKLIVSVPSGKYLSFDQRALPYALCTYP